jgi:hypothetical protein
MKTSSARRRAACETAREVKAINVEYIDLIAIEDLMDPLEAE